MQQSILPSLLQVSSKFYRLSLLTAYLVTHVKLTSPAACMMAVVWNAFHSERPSVVKRKASIVSFRTRRPSLVVGYPQLLQVHLAWIEWHLEGCMP